MCHVDQQKYWSSVLMRLADWRSSWGMNGGMIGDEACYPTVANDAAHRCATLVGSMIHHSAKRHQQTDPFLHNEPRLFILAWLAVQKLRCFYSGAVFDNIMVISPERHNEQQGYIVNTNQLSLIHHHFQGGSGNKHNAIRSAAGWTPEKFSLVKMVIAFFTIKYFFPPA